MAENQQYVIEIKSTGFKLLGEGTSHEAALENAIHKLLASDSSKWAGIVAVESPDGVKRDIAACAVLADSEFSFSCAMLPEANS